MSPLFEFIFDFFIYKTINPRSLDNPPTPWLDYVNRLAEDKLNDQVIEDEHTRVWGNQYGIIGVYSSLGFKQILLRSLQIRRSSLSLQYTNSKNSISSSAFRRLGFCQRFYFSIGQNQPSQTGMQETLRVQLIHNFETELRHTRSLSLDSLSKNLN